MRPERCIAAHAPAVCSARSRTRPMRRASLDFHARCATPVRRKACGTMSTTMPPTVGATDAPCMPRVPYALRGSHVTHATRVARFLFWYALHVAHGPSFRMEGVRHARPIMPQKAHSRRRPPCRMPRAPLRCVQHPALQTNTTHVVFVVFFRVGVKLLILY